MANWGVNASAYVQEEDQGSAQGVQAPYSPPHREYAIRTTQKHPDPRSLYYGANVPKSLPSGQTVRVPRTEVSVL